MKEKKALQDKLTSNDILREAAALAKEDVLISQQKYEERAISIDKTFAVQPDENFLRFARAYDQQHIEVPVKKTYTYWTKRIVRTAAIFLACFVTMGSMALGTSEALREKVFSLFFNEESGSVTLRSETEEEMLGSWEDYWYPEWIPKEFYLFASREEDHLMLFVSESSDCRIRIQEYNLNTSVSIDVETAEIEEVSVNDKKIIISTDENYKRISAVLQTESRILEVDIENSTDKDMIIKIIGNMKYIK